jgi:hypothetical protein
MTRFLLVIVTLLGTSALAQNVYYVSPSGSDSNPGTQSSPWKTINHAAAAMTVPGAGVVVHVLPGTYPEAVNITKSGTANGYVRFVSDTKWGARVTGSSASSVLWSFFGRSYVEINGFELDGSGVDTCCAIDATANFGLKILNNKIHDIVRQHDNSGHGSVIMLNADAGQFVGSTGGNNIIQGNFIYHNNWGAPAAGAAPYGIYSQKPGDIIQNNIIVQQGGGWCIQLWHQATNAVVTNNTLINCDRGGVIVGNDRTQSPDVNDFTTVSNNIIVNNGSNGGQYGIVEYGSNCTAVGPHNVYQNNLVYGNLPSNISLCGGKTPTSTLSGSNSMFVNYTGDGSGDYTLKPGSQGIGAGTTSCASGVTNCIPAIDFAQVVRPTPPTIGAIERTGLASLPDAPTGLTAQVQ